LGGGGGRQLSLAYHPLPSLIKRELNYQRTLINNCEGFLMKNKFAVIIRIALLSLLISCANGKEETPNNFPKEISSIDWIIIGEISDVQEKFDEYNTSSINLTESNITYRIQDKPKKIYPVIDYQVINNESNENKIIQLLINYNTLYCRMICYSIEYNSILQYQTEWYDISNNQYYKISGCAISREVLKNMLMSGLSIEESNEIKLKVWEGIKPAIKKTHAEINPLKDAILKKR
jgi:hypothetical protein